MLGKSKQTLFIDKNERNHIYYLVLLGSSRLAFVLFRIVLFCFGCVCVCVCFVEKLYKRGWMCGVLNVILEIIFILLWGPRMNQMKRNCFDKSGSHDRTPVFAFWFHLCSSLISPALIHFTDIHMPPPKCERAHLHFIAAKRYTIDGWIAHEACGIWKEKN